jgi:dTDP-4-dehydrorhamnose reductase
VTEEFKLNKILIVGASGMLGSALYRYFSEQLEFDVYGTVRSELSKDHFPMALRTNIFTGIDVSVFDSINNVLAVAKPDVVINCVGLVKQLSDVDDPLIVLPLNALFPHKLARVCAVSNARLIHFSTDCVFNGSKGMYSEDDFTDSPDLYGVSKRLGEVDYDNAITLRTSIIGHELEGKRSLIDWFLSENGSVRGFDRAIFSGLPTVEIARIISEFVIPNPHLRGVYHLSAQPICKYDLLSLVAETYGKKIQIIKDIDFRIDRSLDSSRFRDATGFFPNSWPTLVRLMYEFK